MRDKKDPFDWNKWIESEGDQSRGTIEKERTQEKKDD